MKIRIMIIIIIIKGVYIFVMYSRDFLSLPANGRVGYIMPFCTCCSVIYEARLYKLRNDRLNKMVPSPILV